MPHTAARMGTRERDPGRYQHHRPEQILLYQVVEEYCPAFTAHFVEQGRKLPGYVPRRAPGRLQLQMSGFFCPRCGTRRMVESAALLVEEVLPEQPIPKDVVG